MTWRATVLTIFPEMLPGPLAYSLAGKALRAGLWRLAVLPEWRRRGVARALVAEAERRLLAKRARRMSVLAEENDPRATAFWEARTDMGYVRDPGARRYVKMLGPDPGNSGGP